MVRFTKFIIAIIFSLLAIKTSFAQQECKNIVDISTKESTYWIVLSGPDKTLQYPFKAFLINRKSNWEQDATTNKTFENCSWISPYKEGIGKYNTSKEPFVLQFNFNTNTKENVFVNLKSLYDNAACFLIDGIQIKTMHPFTALNTAMHNKKWCTNAYNTTIGYDGSKTMNFTYNATSNENTNPFLLNEGNHIFKILLHSETNSEIGIVLSGNINSGKNKIFCTSKPIVKDVKDTVVIIKPKDEPIKPTGESKWTKATLANVYFSDGTFSILNKKQVTTNDYNKYTYLDAKFICSEKNSNADIGFEIIFPSGKVAKGKAITDGFNLSETGTYQLNYYAICNGTISNNQSVTIVVVESAVVESCKCFPSPLFQYQYFDSKYKGSETENKVSYSTIKGKLGYRHQIRHQYDCSSFECKKTGDIMVSDTLGNVLYTQSFKGLYNFEPTKAGTYNIVITEKCNTAVCEPIYITMVIEEEKVVEAEVPIDENLKGAFKLQQRTANGNEPWKDIEINSTATIKTSSIAYTHIAGLSIKGTYENATKQSCNLNYVLRNNNIPGSVNSYPFACNVSGTLPLNSYESNILKNQDNKQIITVYANNNNRVIDSVNIYVSTKGYNNTPNFYKLYKIGDAKLEAISLSNHLPENIITGGTSIYKSAVSLKNISTNIDYIRITVDLRNQNQPFDKSIVGYDMSKYVNSNSIIGVNRNFAIVYAKENADAEQILPNAAVEKNNYRFENEDSLVVRDAQINTSVLKGFANSLGNKVTLIPKKGIKNVDIPFTIVMPGLSTLNDKIKLDKLVVTVLVHYINCEGNYLSYNAQFDKKTGKFGLLKLVEQ